MKKTLEEQRLRIIQINEQIGLPGIDYKNGFKVPKEAKEQGNYHIGEEPPHPIEDDKLFEEEDDEKKKLIEFLKWQTSNYYDDKESERIVNNYLKDKSINSKTPIEAKEQFGDMRSNLFNSLHKADNPNNGVKTPRETKDEEPHPIGDDHEFEENLKGLKDHFANDNYNVLIATKNSFLRTSQELQKNGRDNHGLKLSNGIVRIIDELLNEKGDTRDDFDSPTLRYRDTGGTDGG